MCVCVYLHADNTASAAAVLTFTHCNVTTAESVKSQNSSDAVADQTHLHTRVCHMSIQEAHMEMLTTLAQKTKTTDLAGESRPLQGFDEVTVDLIGSHYDRCHGVLVVWCRGGQ